MACYPYQNFPLCCVLNDSQKERNKSTLAPRLLSQFLLELSTLRETLTKREEEIKL